MSKLSDEAKEKIKAELLKTGEAISREAIDLTFNIIEIVIKDTENKFDDTVLPFLPSLKDFVLSYIDKISEE